MRRRAVHEAQEEDQQGSPVQQHRRAERRRHRRRPHRPHALLRLRLARCSPRIPTEVQRKSILDAERAIADLLRRPRAACAASASAPPTRPSFAPASRSSGRPACCAMPSSTVRDEIENVLSYYQLHVPARDPQALCRAGASSSAAPCRALLPHGQLDRRRPRRQPQRQCRYPASRAAAPGETALRYYLTEVHELGAELSHLAHAGRLHAATCRAWPTRSGDANAHRDDEPYRRALIGIYARLAGTLARADRHEALRHAVAPGTPYAGRGEFLADLHTIDDFLRRNHGAAMIRHAARPAHPRGRGLRLPSRHHRPAPELRPARGRAWPSCSPSPRIEPRLCRARRGAKQQLLLALLQDPRGRCACAPPTTPSATAGRAGHLRGRARAARALRPRGHPALHHQPHRDGQRPARSAACCRRKCGLMRGTLAPPKPRAPASTSSSCRCSRRSTICARRADHARLLRPAGHRGADPRTRARSRT